LRRRIFHQCTQAKKHHKQRNTREENKAIKNNETPEHFLANPHKLAQKDLDARWTKKNGETFYGFKNHIEIDKTNKLITNSHDSQIIIDLVSNDAKELYADSAYQSAKITNHLQSKEITPHIIKKALRNTPLTQQDKINNSKISKTRSRVEHVFGALKNQLIKVSIIVSVL
jgi:transposase, IS5 family